MTYLASTAALRTARFGSSSAFCSSRITLTLCGCTLSYCVVIASAPNNCKDAMRNRCPRIASSQYARGREEKKLQLRLQGLTTEDNCPGLVIAFRRVAEMRLPTCSKTMDQPLCRRLDKPSEGGGSLGHIASSASITLARKSASGRSSPCNNKGAS